MQADGYQKKQPVAQASMKLRSAATSTASGAAPFIVNPLSPIQRNNEASAAASQRAQCRARIPSALTTPCSMPAAAMPTLAKKEVNGVKQRPALSRPSR
jgi:hypothetical protein